VVVARGLAQNGQQTIVETHLVSNPSGRTDQRLYASVYPALRRSCLTIPKRDKERGAGR
jgi:hypothetical protein